jgi:hypothetical protein
MAGKTLWYKPRKRARAVRDVAGPVLEEDENLESGAVFFDEEEFEEEDG